MTRARTGTQRELGLVIWSDFYFKEIFLGLCCKKNQKGMSRKKVGDQAGANNDDPDDGRGQLGPGLSQWQPWVVNGLSGGLVLEKEGASISHGSGRTMSSSCLSWEPEGRSKCCIKNAVEPSGWKYAGGCRWHPVQASTGFHQRWSPNVLGREEVMGQWDRVQHDNILFIIFMSNNWLSICLPINIFNWMNMSSAWSS